MTDLATTAVIVGTPIVMSALIFLLAWLEEPRTRRRRTPSPTTSLPAAK